MQTTDKREYHRRTKPTTYKKTVDVEISLLAAVKKNPFESASYYAKEIGKTRSIVLYIYGRWKDKYEITPLWRFRRSVVEKYVAEHPTATTSDVANAVGTTPLVVGQTLALFETEEEKRKRLRRDKLALLKRRKEKRREKTKDKPSKYVLAYRADPEKYRANVEKIKKMLVENPFKSIDQIRKETNASEGAANRANEELKREGWFRDLEREILLEEFIENNPGASLLDAAKYFGTDRNVLLRTAGAWRLNPDSPMQRHINYVELLGDNVSIEDSQLESRVCIPPEWYVCEVQKRGGLGVKLPPDEFERYLKLYERRKRIGPARISLESEGIVVK